MDVERISESANSESANGNQRTRNTEYGIRNTHHASRPKLLFLTSPNNPDGSLLAPDDLRRLLDLPLIVVLDEAYIEFAGLERSVAGWVTGAGEPDRPAHLQQVGGDCGAAAGLRHLPGLADAGAVEGQAAVQRQRRCDRGRAGVVAHRAEIQITVDALIIDRERLFRELAQFPFLRPYPSQANFVLCRVVDRDAKALKEALAGAGDPGAALRQTRAGELHPRQRGPAGADRCAVGGAGRSIVRVTPRVVECRHEGDLT